MKKVEKQAIEQLALGLKAHFGPRLLHTFLFGSKARGDDGPDSDIDVLVVLNRDIAESDRRDVSDIVFEVLDSCGIYIQTVVLAEEEFERPRGQLRWLTSFVRDEGIAL